VVGFGRSVRSTDIWSPLLGKERVRVRFFVFAEVDRSVVAKIGTSPRPSPWKGEGGLLGAEMFGSGESLRSTDIWSPLLSCVEG
jgi:hypothetical protein